MSNSDTAFINAYRRTSEDSTEPQRTALRELSTLEPGIQPGLIESPIVITRSEAATAWQYGNGPHVAFADAGVEPEQLTSNDVQANAFSAAELASTLVARFNWPALVTDLVEQSPQLFANLLVSLEKKGSAFGLVGVSPHSGCTTTALSLAYAATTADTLTAVVDAAPGVPSLSESLGLVQSQTLIGSRIGHRSAKDAIVHSLQDGLSVAVAGSDVSPTSIDGTSRATNPTLAAPKSLLNPLTSKHQLTLVDMGSGPDAFRTLLKQGAHTWEAWGIEGVLLVHCPEDGPTASAHAQAMLESIDTPLIGIIESQVALSDASLK